MKKILAILLAATLMLSLLSACGKAPAEQTEAPTETATETAQQPADAEKAPEAATETADETAQQPADAEKAPEEAASEEQPAAETTDVQQETSGLTVSLASATVEAGTKSVTVPVKIAANTGLAGAFVTVKYDAALKLTDAKAGDALGSLTLTPGGDLSANPYNLLWDGQDADASNGDIALLTFDVPNEPGEYKIALSGDPESFYDNEMNNVPVNFAGGSITVTAKG